MREILILLNSVDKVRDFVSITVRFDADMNLISDGKIIDAKSIMGILSMDLSKTMLLRIYEEGKNAAELIHALSAYTVHESTDGEM